MSDRHGAANNGREVVHVAALDGVRAIAIALVVLFHTLPFASGGYVGVEIFFVLSGFLITTLLLGEFRATGTIDRAAFYARRAIRLLPALCVLMALAVVLAVATGSNNGGLPIRRALPPVILYYGNWMEAAGGSLGYLSHTWSLAVEEQFYIAWPLLMLVLVRRKNSLPLLVAGAVTIALIRAVLTPVAPSAENLGVWTTSKADCLLIGAIMAFGMVRWRDRLLWHAAKTWTGWAGIGSLAAVFAFLSIVPSPARWSDYGMTTVVALATAVLLAHVVVCPTSGLARSLAWRPLRGLGRVSYGVYLFHWPIVAWVGAQAWSYASRLLVEYSLTAAAVALSWFAIERPAMRYKSAFRRRRVSIAAMRHDLATASDLPSTERRSRPHTAGRRWKRASSENPAISARDPRMSSW